MARIETLALPALVAARARRLEEPRCHNAEREPAERERPRLPAPEVLNVGQELVAAGITEPAAHSVDVACGLIGELRRLVLALLAQLLANRPDVVGGGADALTNLGGALIDLGPGTLT